ncbi:DUF1059 domain-containing protein [Aliifodinibius sp. S!AR15-10]|uniref:DUF1059 domain-containing protein n=1 Tax=Aliifodinibius sp. S!AR15-10 TaxID=2950437 RepID=UPI0028599640|nr:DUF1059 domain-containing protein [Aliifodinibius sp. S!AR15-10]MDR8390100.1 DUF1059 domain-containing protein [Aliifodinibius sp. S!AR15-10]
MKTLACRDAGFDCNHVIKANTVEEVLSKAAEHAQQVHGLKEINEATAKKIRAQIKDTK